MDNTASISCSIGTTDATAELGMEIWINDTQIFNSEHITETVDFEHLINDELEASCELRFVMKNKTEKHTVIDKNNEIVTDALLTISKLMFAGINVDFTLCSLGTYTHDFNGSQEEIQDNFYGEMGCNGTVNLKFSTPIYVWLLENM